MRKSHKADWATSRNKKHLRKFSCKMKVTAAKCRNPHFAFRPCFRVIFRVFFFKSVVFAPILVKNVHHKVPPQSRRFLGGSSEVPRRFLGGSSEVFRRFLGGPRRFLGGSSEVLVHLKSNSQHLRNRPKLSQKRLIGCLCVVRQLKFAKQRVTYANLINQRQQCFSGTTTRQYISIRSAG